MQFVWTFASLLAVCIPEDEGPRVSWLEDGWTARVSSLLTCVSSTAKEVSGLLIGV